MGRTRKLPHTCGRSDLAREKALAELRRALVRVTEEIRKLELRVSAPGLEQVVIHTEADQFRGGAES